MRIRPELLARGGCKLDPGWRVAAGPPLVPTAVVKTAKGIWKVSWGLLASSHETRLKN